MTTRQEGLTDVQNRILGAIEGYWEAHRIAPEYRDIMKAAALKSHGSLMRSLYALRKYGIVDWEDNKSRTIRVIRKGEPPVSPAGVLRGETLADWIRDYCVELGYRAKRAGESPNYYTLANVASELTLLLNRHEDEGKS